MLIVATGAIHVLQGKYMYALMCAAVIIVLVVPPLLARSSRANMPVELELASLWAAVSDMTLGRLAGLYAGTVWFDKLLHFGNSMLIGMLAFLIVYALQFTGRLRPSSTDWSSCSSPWGSAPFGRSRSTLQTSPSKRERRVPRDWEPWTIRCGT